MKKSVLLLTVFSIILAGCFTIPEPVRDKLEIEVELRPGGPLQLRSGGSEFRQAVSGIRGVPIDPVDVLITFKNDVLREDVRPGTEVKWITNMPRGLKARVREARRGSSRIILLVEGTPQDILNDAMKLSIPGSLNQREQDLNYSSEQVKFEILQGSVDVSQRTDSRADAVNFVYINGSVRTRMETFDLKVSLIGSVLKNAIERETSVSWIMNIPNGLSVTIQPAEAGAVTLYLTVRGIPQEAKNEPVQVVIPSFFLGDVNDFKVPNEVLWWRITGSSIGSVVINGSVDSAIIAKDITINLMGDEFLSDMAPGTSVNWITNLPAGLTSRVKRVRAGERTGIITVSGTPTEVSTNVLAISIQASAVRSRTVIPVITNVDARFAINANTRQITVTEDASGSSNPNWMGTQRGPLNIPLLPAIKDFEGIGLVTVRATAVEKLGADNQYHWTGNTVNYGMLIEAASRLNAHAIINIVVDYTDNVEYKEVIRELAREHEWSDDELDKISRGILREIRKDNVRYVAETSHVITRTYIASALAIKYINGLEYFEAEQLRSTRPQAVRQ